MILEKLKDMYILFRNSKTIQEKLLSKTSFFDFCCLASTYMTSESKKYVLIDPEIFSYLTETDRTESNLSSSIDAETWINNVYYLMKVGTSFSSYEQDNLGTEQLQRLFEASSDYFNVYCVRLEEDIDSFCINFVERCPGLLDYMTNITKSSNVKRIFSLHGEESIGNTVIIDAWDNIPLSVIFERDELAIINAYDYYRILCTKELSFQNKNIYGINLNERLIYFNKVLIAREYEIFEKKEEDTEKKDEMMYTDIFSYNMIHPYVPKDLSNSYLICVYNDRSTGDTRINFEKSSLFLTLFEEKLRKLRGMKEISAKEIDIIPLKPWFALGPSGGGKSTYFSTVIQHVLSADAIYRVDIEENISGTKNDFSELLVDKEKLSSDSVSFDLLNSKFKVVVTPLKKFNVFRIVISERFEKPVKYRINNRNLEEKNKSNIVTEKFITYRYSSPGFVYVVLSALLDFNEDNSCNFVIFDSLTDNIFGLWTHQRLKQESTVGKGGVHKESRDDILFISDMMNKISENKILNTLFPFVIVSTIEWADAVMNYRLVSGATDTCCTINKMEEQQCLLRTRASDLITSFEKPLHLVTPMTKLFNDFKKFSTLGKKE
jgi:hypothetical protein